MLRCIDNSEKSRKTATNWEQTLKDIIWSTDDTDPRFRNEKWHQVFDDQLKISPMTIQSADPLFSLPIGRHTEEWTVWLPCKEAVWERFHTISHIANLKGNHLEVSRSSLTMISLTRARKRKKRSLKPWTVRMLRRTRKVKLLCMEELSLLIRLPLQPTH